MDTTQAFRILECEQTKDKAVITDAYRKKLVTVNPEEDPKGFMELRAAFDAAVKYSQEAEEEECIKIPQTPMDLFMKKVEDLYFSKEDRLNPAAWEKVLEEDVCVYLETADEALRQLLIFFMDHFRLPQPIFKAIDQKVGLTTKGDDFYEEFPEDFVRFIKSAPLDENFFPFELVEGEDFTQIDEYIRLYYDCKHFFDLKQIDEVKSTLKQMDQLSLDHPFTHVEKLGLAHLEGDREAMERELAYLNEYEPKNEFILFHIAYYYTKQGKYEQAQPVVDQILEKNPNHYSACKLRYEYWFETGKYKEARKGFLDLLDYENHDPDLVEKLQKCNEIVIPILEKEFEENHDYEALMESCWALFQNDRQEEALKKLENYPEEERNSLNYDNICGKMYASLQRYGEAIPHLKRWSEALKQVVDDGSEKNKKEIKKIPYSTLMIVNCYMELGKNSKNQNEYFEKAINEMPKDLSKDDEHYMNYMTMRAYIKLTLHEYHDCIDICDEILKIDHHHIYAHIYMQEAFYEVRSGQNVVDEYHYLKEYAPGYIKSYEFAARVFFAYGQHEDVFSVVEEARKREVDSLLLEFLFTRSKRYIADGKEQMEELADKYKEIIHKMETEESDIEDRLEVYREQIYLYMDMKNFGTALSLCEKLPQNEEDVDRNLYMKADILRQDERYKEAVKIFIDLDKRNPDYEVYAFNAARCYHEMDQEEKEKEYLIRTLKINPQHQNANGHIADILKKRLKSYWDWNTFYEAIDYASKQIEILPNCYYLIERGLLYLDAGMLEPAMKDFQAAIEDDPEDLYAYNNMGFAYEQSWDFEKACEYYEKSMELVKEKETGLPFVNAGDSYMALGDFEKAIKAYQKRLEMFPNSAEYVLRKMAECCHRLGHFEEANKYYDELRKHVTDPEDIEDDTLSRGDLFLDMGREEQALSCYQKYASKSLMKKKGTVTIKGLRRMANFYGYDKNDWVKAKTFAKKAWAMAELEDGNDYINALITYMTCNFYLNNMEENKKLYDKAQEYFSNCLRGGREAYLSTPVYRPLKYRRLFDVEYLCGNLEEAKSYLKVMEESPRCASCDFRKCVDALEAEILILISEQKREEALELVRELEEVNPMNQEAKLLRNLLG